MHSFLLSYPLPPRPLHPLLRLVHCRIVAALWLYDEIMTFDIFIFMRALYVYFDVFMFYACHVLYVFPLFSDHGCVCPFCFRAER